MGSERNRINKLKEYFKSLGICINIGKTKARGNMGFFLHTTGNYRIDISSHVDDSNMLPVLVHEFAHYVHYQYDKKLSSLDFVFDDLNDEIIDELIQITVQKVPKDFAMSLFSKKDKLQSEIQLLYKKISSHYEDLKLSKPYLPIERQLPNHIKYLIKYDRVKYLNHIYSIGDKEVVSSLNNLQLNYIEMKSKQRKLKCINSKISRLNKYYNNVSELFARFVETYYTNYNSAKKYAPKATQLFENADIPIFKKLNEILF